MLHSNSKESPAFRRGEAQVRGRKMAVPLRMTGACACDECWRCEGQCQIQGETYDCTCPHHAIKKHDDLCDRRLL